VEEQQGARQSGHRANVAEQVEENLGELVEVVEHFLPLENAEHAVEHRSLLVEKRVEANLQVEVLLDAVDVYGAFLEDLEKEGGPFGLIGVEQHVCQQNKHDSNDDQLVFELETDQLQLVFPHRLR